jgi:hypothetical protein
VVPEGPIIIRIANGLNKFSVFRYRQSNALIPGSMCCRSRWLAKKTQSWLFFAPLVLLVLSNADFDVGRCCWRTWAEAAGNLPA